jgi:hypothetical protein
MERIFSKVEPGKLLHIVHRREDIQRRVDVVPSEEFLQVSSFRMERGKTFKPHKHIVIPKMTNITQESWIVVQGAVMAILYDLDDTEVARPILKPGDCSITLYGGHNYVAMEDDTLVYEYKTGPYFGQEKDKAFL